MKGTKGKTRYFEHRFRHGMLIKYLNRKEKRMKKSVGKTQYFEHRFDIDTVSGQVVLAEPVREISWKYTKSIL